MSAPINLYKKLHIIQQSICALDKDKNAMNYRYVGGNKILNHIKPLMDEHSLLLSQEVLSIDNERQDYQVHDYRTNQVKNKSEILSKVMMKFTWIDVESGETLECMFGANGQNNWEKGLGSALTYAERYFLLKFFHIETDRDDIDNPHRKANDQVKEDETVHLQKIKDCKTVDQLLKLYQGNELYYKSNDKLINAFKYAKDNLKDKNGNTVIGGNKATALVIALGSKDLTKEKLQHLELEISNMPKASIAVKTALTEAKKRLGL